MCRKTHPSLYSSCYVQFWSVSGSTKWTEASALICEIMRGKSEGKYAGRLFCWTICKPVNAAVIKGYHGRGHPAGGLPASTRIVPQRNSFTLRHSPATPRVWFDIRRGTILMRVSLGNRLLSCRKHAHVSWMRYGFSFLAQMLAGMGCWEVITKYFLTLSLALLLLSLVPSEVATAIPPPHPLPPPPSPSSASSSHTSNCVHIQYLVLIFKFMPRWKQFSFRNSWQILNYLRSFPSSKLCF